jgi:predicted Ser/Thr protein kinase
MNIFEKMDDIGRVRIPLDKLDASPYKLVKELGRGTFGATYEGVYKGKHYAIKLSLQPKKSMKVFKKEYDMLEKGAKAGISPKVYGFNEDCLIID